MENDRFTLPRERFSPRFLPFPLLSTGEKEKDVRGRENFHSLSSTPRFVSPFFLSLHASFPRASLGIGRSINPAQIKLSRHRIFNGRCLIYEGERINVSIKLHRVWRPRQLFDPVRDNFSFFSLSIPHLRIHVYIYSTRRNTVDRREFIATSTRSKLPPIYSRHFQRYSQPRFFLPLLCPLDKFSNTYPRLTRNTYIDSLDLNWNVPFPVFSFPFECINTTRVSFHISMARISGRKSKKNSLQSTKLNSLSQNSITVNIPFSNSNPLKE